MKKKKKSKKNFKIGDPVTFMFHDRVIYGTILDKDHALDEYRIQADRPGDMRIFWIKKSKIRLRRVLNG